MTTIPFGYDLPQFRSISFMDIGTAPLALKALAGGVSRSNTWL
jgi:hypothetical protein